MWCTEQEIKLSVEIKIAYLYFKRTVAAVNKFYCVTRHFGNKRPGTNFRLFFFLSPIHTIKPVFFGIARFSDFKTLKITHYRNFAEKKLALTSLLATTW